jgi:AmmeMemoRadiSam system protein B
LYYSGPTAAWAYKYVVKPNNIERVFIFGPSHHKYFPGCTLTHMDEYSTPLGPLAVDIEGNQFLIQLLIN